MTGERAPVGEGVRPTASRRVRVVAAVVGVLSVVAFGAVARAAGNPDPPDPDPISDLKLAGADTSEPATSELETIVPETSGPATSEPAPSEPDDSASPDDSEVDVIGSVPADPPEGLGDDPDLDALAQSCFDGELVDCDLLYLQSPIDSDYEEYGDSCAGRQEAGTENYCGLQAGEPIGPDTSLPPDDTDPIVSGDPVTPANLGDDPDLDSLAEDCYAGDMGACDDLYFDAEGGSEYQAYGDTCAGRQPENTGRLCANLVDPVPGTGDVPTPGTDEPVETSAPSDSTEPTSESTESPSESTEPPSESTEPPSESTEPPPESTEPGPETTDEGPATTQAVISGEIPAPTIEPTGLGNDPQLDELAQSCYDGDMAACDDLYRASEAETDYRAYGDTCAGRQPEDTGDWCVDAFGGDEPDTTDVGEPDDTTVVGPTSSTTPFPGPDQSTVPPVPPTPPSTGAPTVTTTGPTGPTTPLAPGVIPPPTIEPVNLGADPALDALAQSCYDGDMAACDELYRTAEPDTPYREYADTCAGRQQPRTGVWCEVAFASDAGSTTVPGPTVPGPITTGSQAPSTTVSGPTTTGPSVAGIPAATIEPTDLGDDPELDALAQSCFDGDMQACDDLFDQSDIGSAYQTYGDTCAGRQPEHTFNYCHVVFPGGGQRRP